MIANTIPTKPKTGTRKTSPRKRARYGRLDHEISVLETPKGALFFFEGKLGESINAVCDKENITPDELLRRVIADFFSNPANKRALAK